MDIDELSFPELAKLYSALKKHLPEMLTDEFNATVFDTIILEKVVKENGKEVDADSLGYILPLLDFKSMLPEIQSSVLNVLRRKNFSTSSYILCLGQILEKIEEVDGSIEDRKQKLIRSDLEFWR